MLAALILRGFSFHSLLSNLRSRDPMDCQITRVTLLLTPMLASGLMGNNHFITDTLLSSERNTLQIQDYLARIQQKTEAITTFLVANKSVRYYYSSDILKHV